MARFKEPKVRNRRKKVGKVFKPAVLKKYGRLIRFDPWLSFEPNFEHPVHKYGQNLLQGVKRRLISCGLDPDDLDNQGTMKCFMANATRTSRDGHNVMLFSTRVKYYQQVNRLLDEVGAAFLNYGPLMKMFDHFCRGRIFRYKGNVTFDRYTPDIRTGIFKVGNSCNFSYNPPVAVGMDAQGREKYLFRNDYGVDGTTIGRVNDILKHNVLTFENVDDGEMDSDEFKILKGTVDFYKNKYFYVISQGNRCMYLSGHWLTELPEMWYKFVKIDGKDICCLSYDSPLKFAACSKKKIQGFVVPTKRDIQEVALGNGNKFYDYVGIKPPASFMTGMNETMTRAIQQYDEIRLRLFNDPYRGLPPSLFTATQYLDVILMMSRESMPTYYVGDGYLTPRIYEDHLWQCMREHYYHHHNHLPRITKVF